MSPLVMALLGRTLGPSIARDLPSDLRAPANILMNPVESLLKAAIVGGGSLYDYVNNRSTYNKYLEDQLAEMEYGPPAPSYPSYSNIGGGLSHLFAGELGMRQEAGDTLRESIASLLPKSIAKVVTPNYETRGLSPAEIEDLIPLYDEPSPQYEAFRQAELAEQGAGYGGLEQQPSELTPEYTAPTISNFQYPDLYYGPKFEMSFPAIPDISFEMPSFEVPDFDYGNSDFADYGEYFRRGGKVKL